MMTLQEIKQLGSIARQIRGLIVGIEKLPEACDDLERREDALVAKADRIVELDRMIAQKTADLAGIEARVHTKALSEQHRRRVEMDEQLKGLTTQIADDERRAATAKAAADQEEQRLRNMHEGITKLGLTPLERP